MDWYLYDKASFMEGLNVTVEHMAVFYLNQRKVAILQLVVL